VTFEDTVEVSTLEDPFLLSIPALDKQIDMDWASKTLSIGGKVDLNIVTRLQEGSRFPPLSSCASLTHTRDAVGSSAIAIVVIKVQQYSVPK